jgi:glutaredoxin-like YruB-family protein
MSMAAKATIYSTPTCAYCNQAKKYFKEIRLPFTDYDISRDERKREELVRKSGQMGVPVIFLKGQKIIGFDKARINHILGLT